MRETPLVVTPHRGTNLGAAMKQLSKSMNDLAQWMNETAQEIVESRTDAALCTDCDEHVRAADRQKHMADEHGVMYAIPEAACPQCDGEHPCERVVEGLKA